MGGGATKTAAKCGDVSSDPIEEILPEKPKKGMSFEARTSLPLTAPVPARFSGHTTGSSGHGAGVPGPMRLAAAVEAAMLPNEAHDAVLAWIQDNGAIGCGELLEGDRLQKLAERAQLKPLEVERLRKELKSCGDCHVDYVGGSASTSSSNPEVVQASGSRPHAAGKVVPRHTHIHVAGTSRPRRIVFIRHGESEANVDRGITVWVPDHELHLTPKGRQQASDAGVRLKKLLGEDLRRVTFVVSPYVRARETLNGILFHFEESDPQVLMDVRIREQEFGNFDRPDISQLHKEKSVFGAFYYRFPDGESPADCFDRGAMFLEHLFNTWDSSMTTCVIVSHGMMILVMLMRILGYPVDDFESFGLLGNCEFVVLERQGPASAYEFAFSWAEGEEQDVTGLRRVEPPRRSSLVWDGNPQAPVTASKVRKSVIEVVGLSHLRHTLTDKAGLREAPVQPAGFVWDNHSDSMS